MLHLHPFAIEVLNSYNIIVSELYPNGCSCIVGFVIICIALGIKSTFTAFRNMFRLKKCIAIQGLGWLTLQYRRGFLPVDG